MADKSIELEEGERWIYLKNYKVNLAFKTRNNNIKFHTPNQARKLLHQSIKIKKESKSNDKTIETQ